MSVAACSPVTSTITPSCASPGASSCDTTGSPARSASGPTTAARQSFSTARRSALAHSVVDEVDRAEAWNAWATSDVRVAAFATLADAIQGWRDRDERCYEVVAALTGIGSRRGGDSDLAAMAVVLLLEDGVRRLALTKLRDVCHVDDVVAATWEEVKRAEPDAGVKTASNLLKRARQRLTRPSGGMLSRVPTVALEPWVVDAAESDPRTAALDTATSSEDDLVDLLSWATGEGVLDRAEVDLIVELIAAENDGLPREAAQQLVGERRGVSMRTIRRRRDAATTRLQQAAPTYLAAIA